ncbi:MAG: TerB N-terminal domain-containing protein, partial [Desulfobacterales bacterium]|nr:TerB N-terminal domain-containing protein [Desulfobacterales bacterium]
MAKKSGGGGIGLVLVGGAIVFLAAVPKEVWITVAVVGAIGAVLYFIAKSKKDAPEAPSRKETWKPPAPSPSRSYTGAARAAAAAQEPVSVYREPAPEPGRRVPAAPAGYGSATWIPPGHSVTVAGTNIPEGMVYVGTSLRTPSGRADPCLLDPSKKVAARADYTDRNLMGYWPSYS